MHIGSLRALTPPPSEKRSKGEESLYQLRDVNLATAKPITLKAVIVRIYEAHKGGQHTDIAITDGSSIAMCQISGQLTTLESCSRQISISNPDIRNIANDFQRIDSSLQIPYLLCFSLEAIKREMPARDVGLFDNSPNHSEIFFSSARHSDCLSVGIGSKIKFLVKKMLPTQEVLVSGRCCKKKVMSIMGEKGELGLFTIWNKDADCAVNWKENLTTIFLFNPTIKRNSRGEVLISMSRQSFYQEKELPGARWNLEELPETIVPCTVEKISEIARHLRYLTISKILIKNCLSFTSIDLSAVKIVQITCQKCSSKNFLDQFTRKCLICGESLGLCLNCRFSTFPITIVDETGSITCQLRDSLIRDYLDIEAEQFINLSSIQLTELRWKLLFKKESSITVCLKFDEKRLFLVAEVVSLGNRAKGI